jgi:hypothetical protein
METSEPLSESCEATLTINGRAYDGTTTAQNGHAEMHALDQFCRQYATPHDAAHALLRARGMNKIVRCTSRPVCQKCGYILRALEFQCDAQTHWGDKNAGKTEWAVTPLVREVLKQANVDYQKAQSLTNK